MILIIGGCFQGKLDYALSYTQIPGEAVADGLNCEMEAIFKAPLVNHFHEYIRRALKENGRLLQMVPRLLSENPDVVLVCNELGYGIVPVDAFDREYREAVGRTLGQLAKESREVHRVLCGLGQKIKG